MRPPFDNRRVRVAIIGAGGWGAQHARVFASRDDVELCAIVGRTPEKTQSRAMQFHVRAYTDIAEMLREERPNLVSLSLPNQEHFAVTMQVIEAGVALFVEKPLVFEMKQADALLRAANERNLFFAINFNHRYAKPALLAKQAIEAGKLGTLTFATWRFGGEGHSDHSFANLIETQCHGFDLLEYLCGPIQSIMAQMTSFEGRGHNTMALALHFQSGAVGTLLGSYDSSYAYRGTQMMEINGTRGRIWMEDTVRCYSFQEAGSEVSQSWQAGYFNDFDREFHRTFDRHLDAVIEAWKKGEAPPVPATCGHRALALAHAAIESFESGRRVETSPK